MRTKNEQAREMATNADRLTPCVSYTVVLCSLGAASQVSMSSVNGERDKAQGSLTWPQKLVWSCTH